MKLYRKTFSLLFSLLLVSTGLFAQGYEWGRTDGGLSLDQGLDIVTDAAGNIYTCGYYASDTAFFGSGIQLINSVQLGSFNHVEEMFVAKYDAAGTPQWAVTGGGNNKDRATALAVDGSGNVFVGGYYSDTAMLGGQTLITRNNTRSGFLAKLDASGNFLWVRTAGGNGGSGEVEIESLGCDDAGNVFVGGSLSQTVDFSGTSYSAGGGAFSNGFVAKYTTGGGLAWVTRLMGVQGLGVSELALHPDGTHFATTGIYDDEIQFESVITETALANTRRNLYLAWYDTTGTPVWARSVQDAQVSSVQEPKVNGLAVHSDGSIYMGGNLGYTLDFGGGNVISIDSSNGNQDSDIFLAQFNGSGITQWVVQEGLTENDKCTALTLDAAGNVYISGTYEEPMVIGATTLEYGNNSVYVAKYNAQGAPQWAHGESQSLAEINGIAVSTADQVLMLGDISLYAEFGSIIPDPAGSKDALILKYSQTGAGISEGFEELRFTLFPNPASSHLQIQWEHSDVEAVQLNLYTLTGQCIARKEGIGGTTELPVHALENGVYLLEIRQGNKRGIRKVVVHH